VNDLERWEQTGGKLHIVEISAQHAVVDLCACTGETMERWSTRDPAMIERLQRMLPDVDAATDTG
jgi:hypothetical protein